MIAVRLIRIFEGPRHDRLYNLWDAIAEYLQNKMILRWFNNSGGLDHAGALHAIWSEELEFDENRLVITEHDFLPDLGNPDWMLQEDLDENPDIAIAGACYGKRQPGTKALKNWQRTLGAWFMSFDKSKCPDFLKFRGAVDPCTDLVHHLEASGMNVMLYPGLDPYPKHVGVEYQFGTHLFWSRHLHDDPNLRVSGFRLREIQTKHDEAVTSWIIDQPQDFQDLLQSRFGSDILGSSFEYINARRFFEGFRNSSGSYRTKTVPLYPS